MVLVVGIEKAKFCAVELAAECWHREETPLIIAHRLNASERRNNALPSTASTSLQACSSLANHPLRPPGNRGGSAMSSGPRRAIRVATEHDVSFCGCTVRASRPSRARSVDRRALCSYRLSPPPYIRDSAL